MQYNDMHSKAENQRFIHSTVDSYIKLPEQVGTFKVLCYFEQISVSKNKWGNMKGKVRPKGHLAETLINTLLGCAREVGNRHIAHYDSADFYLKNAFECLI